VYQVFGGGVRRGKSETSPLKIRHLYQTSGCTARCF
jgi:hypothetical protein